MAWLSQFLLGRPGAEYLFEVNPAAMDIEEVGVVIRQANIAGDLKKSTIKASAPIIRVNSNYLTLAQRNKFASLVSVSDTFLSFQTRDDWQQTDERVTIIDATHLRLQNSSATRLSAVLVGLGLPSVITIQTPFNIGFAGTGFGDGGFGFGGFDGAPFDPGAITYDDVTRIITMSNPLADLSRLVFVTYTYKGWLVDMERLGHKAQGGWLDRFTYDFQLMGA